MVEYIVTQELKTEVSKFKAYFEECKSDRTPIAIVGPSGVGKSLFLHIFKKLYENDKKFSKKTIIETDCSHYVGDPNLARSELFGHVKGAFTGATNAKDGLIKNAEGGVLILEEVGNLLPLVQAMLLTFIETGKFRKLGGEKEEKAEEVWVVTATNDESQLRDDLKYRFFPFYIRPLYERRDDILHYLAYKYPEIIKKLRHFEILALLAYNWPGNVREIERIAKAFKIRTSVKIEGEYTQPFQFYPRSKDFSPFDVTKAYALYFELEKHGVNVKLLDSFLNRYRVGLNVDEKCPLSEFKGLESSKDDKLDITFVELNELFADAWQGLDLYCSLFQQSSLSNADLLDISKNQSIEHEFVNLFESKNENKNLLKLTDSIKNYIERLKNSDDQDIDLTNMTFEEIQKLYFSQLLEREGGNQTKAAKLAGMKRLTFRNHSIRLGLIENS